MRRLGIHSLWILIAAFSACAQLGTPRPGAGKEPRPEQTARTLVSLPKLPLPSASPGPQPSPSLLPPGSGTAILRVEPPDAVIELFHRYRLEPGRVSLLPGAYRLQGSRFGFQEGGVDFLVEEGKTTAVELRLDPKPLAIDSDTEPLGLRPGNGGEYLNIGAAADSYGYARVSVLDAAGGCAFRRDFGFIDSYRDLWLVFRGKDSSGKALPAGRYLIRWEAWSIRSPLADGAFPEGEAETRVERELILK